MSHDDEPEPTEQELREAAELARALEDEGDPAPGSDAAFARALRATRKLEPKLESTKRAATVDRAAARGARTTGARRRLRWLAIAAAVLLAIAIPAGLAGPSRSPDSDVAIPALSFGGPTDTIFGGPFADEQRASERMDRIASTRAHDYFAAIAAAEAR